MKTESLKIKVYKSLRIDIVTMEIEQIAIQKAIKHITVEELKNLDDNLELTKMAIKSEKNFQITEIDIKFHSIIYKAAKSKSLFRVCKNLSDLTIKYRHGLNLIPKLWNELLQQHILIYQALISKDREKAAQAVGLHARHANSHLMDIMKKVRSDTFSQEYF